MPLPADIKPSREISITQRFVFKVELGVTGYDNIPHRPNSQYVITCIGMDEAGAKKVICDDFLRSEIACLTAGEGYELNLIFTVTPVNTAELTVEERQRLSGLRPGQGAILSSRLNHPQLEELEVRKRNGKYMSKFP